MSKRDRFFKNFLVLGMILLFSFVSSITVNAAAGEPYGLNSMEQFERLPYLKLDTAAGGASSYDRDGGNDDGFGSSNFLYTDVNNDKVMVDLEGPGTIYRMWFTGYDPATAYIKIYFDGESTPRINMLLKDIFAGTNAPFLSPLVVNTNASSGGFVSNLPLAFNESIKITTNGTGAHFFYNIGYHLYSPDTSVTTWTGNENSTAVRDMWNKAGMDPKSDSGNTTVSGTVNVAAGSSATLLNTAGPRSISSVKLNIPGVAASLKPYQVTDNGRSHLGHSQFTVAIDPNNSGVKLTRRLDYDIANQKADIYIDGTLVGQWYDEGRNGAYKWKTSSFSIPSTYTAGKSSITVKVKFVSSSVDWNEFYYWVYSNVNGTDILTDTLDIANSTSESAHNYSILRAQWIGVRTYTYSPTYDDLTDDGRAHTGYSQFIMSLDPKNQGAVIRRRLDNGIANQKASVYVDGAYVGDWYNSNGAVTDRWKDSEFYIPSAFTDGKSSITIKVQFVSSDVDWNEFYYWVASINGNGQQVTDELDVGQPASEASHNYAINTPTWTGSMTSKYKAPSSNVNDILNNVRLQIFWDGQSAPSVDAPIGSLFAMGEFGPYGTRTLPVGIDEDNNMYMYFSMPFESSAVVKLVNDRSTSTDNILYEIKHKSFNDSFANVGNFKTRFALRQAAANDGNDLLILDESGSGHFLGVVQSIKATLNQGPTDRWHLEGDERIYVDGSRSPVIYGTGTEDFYNGGWYFDKGLFSTPMAGYTAFKIENNIDHTALYRLFLQDTVPFRNHIRVSIEHGAANDIEEDVWMLAYYYHKPLNKAVLTDSLDVGNSSSESSHSYVINSQNWSGSRTFQYEGDFDNVNITDNGRAHTGYSEFTMAINSTNEGVILRRQFDQGIANQKADVYVDGTFVGTWYKAGSNTAKNWRDEDFMIPASLTTGKNSIRIKIQFISSGVDWNEFYYKAYTLVP